MHFKFRDIIREKIDAIKKIKDSGHGKKIILKVYFVSSIQMSIHSYDILSYIFNNVYEDYYLFIYLRKVDKLWNSVITDVLLPRIFMYVDDYTNAINVKVDGKMLKLKLYKRLIFELPSKDFLEPRNYMFEGSTNIEKSGYLKEDLRCCSYTKKGMRCSRKFTQNTRMCKLHHEKIPFINSPSIW